MCAVRLLTQLTVLLAAMGLACSVGNAMRESHGPDGVPLLLSLLCGCLMGKGAGRMGLYLMGR